MSTSDAFAVLHGHQYMNLHSYRRSGEAVVTPVWFALENGSIYFLSQRQTAKLKRIRNNGAVLVGPADQRGTPLGETVQGQARILEGDEAKEADRALSRKYGLLKHLLLGINSLRGASYTYVEIKPG